MVAPSRVSPSSFPKVPSAPTGCPASSHCGIQRAPGLCTWLWIFGACFTCLSGFVFFFFFLVVVIFVAAGLLTLAKRTRWPCASGAFIKVVVLVRYSEGEVGGLGGGWGSRGTEAKGTVTLSLS